MVKKTTADDTQDPGRKPKEGNAGRKVGGIFRFTLMTVLGSMIAILVGGWLLQTRVLDVAQEAEGKRLADVYAQQYVAYFNQIIGQTSRQMANVTRETNLASLLAGNDTGAISAAERTIKASLASKSEVFLLPNASPISDIPLGYAAQEMVERVRNKNDVQPEIIPLKERPLLLLASPVHDAGKQVVGVLLVGFDIREISNDLKQFQQNPGYMELRQTVDGSQDAQVVLHAGDSSISASPFTVVAPTLLPSLKVAFSLSPATVVSQSRGLLWVAMVGVMILVLGSILATGFLLQRALYKNASMLLQYAESLVRRSPTPAGIHFTIDAFDDLAQSLSRAARGPAAADDLALVRGGTARQSKGGADIQIAVVSPEHDEATATAKGGQAGVQVPAEIFRAYDIRGIVGKTLTAETVKLIGKAIGSEALDNQQNAIYVGRDGRLSGPELVDALVEGITSTGCRVVNLGMVPTPLVYFAAANGNIKSGVVLTGSHNPADHNGLKIVINGETLADQRIQALRQRILEKKFREGKGSAETLDVSAKYIERIRDDIVLARPMKIVVDCGNGVAGAIAPQLFKGIGCDVVPLYCEVDGKFPNHHPDPSKPDNLRELIAKVAAEGADLGIAFDGDGDRLGVVTPKGAVIWPDRLMMIYAKDLLMRSPGADIIFDVKCTRDLASVISQHGGRPIMWRTGHSFIKAKLKETGAPLAGEMSGHIFFNDRWFGFDDGMYSAARLLEILSLEVANADDVFAEFPENVATPELHVDVPEERKFGIIEQLQQQAQFPGGNVITIDGVRVDYPNAWGLVRASNTTPVLVCRFEGRTAEDLEKVRAVFVEQLQKIDPALSITS